MALISFTTCQHKSMSIKGLRWMGMANSRDSAHLVGLTNRSLDMPATNGSGGMVVRTDACPTLYSGTCLEFAVTIRQNRYAHVCGSGNSLNSSSFEGRPEPS